MRRYSIRLRVRDDLADGLSKKKYTAISPAITNPEKRRIPRRFMDLGNQFPQH